MATKLVLPKPITPIANAKEPAKLGVPKPPAPTTSVKSPMKMGSTAVKMPKAKKLGEATDKPSVFFKNEQNIRIKGVKALENFLHSVKNKNKA